MIYSAASVLAVVSLATLAPSGMAQKIKPLDELTRKTIERWEQLEYNLGQAGVTKISFDIEVGSRGGMTGKWKAKGRFVFDKADAKHPDGVLTWDDDEVKRALTRRGWTARRFARDVRVDGFRRSLAGGELSSTKKKNWTILLLRAAGEGPDKKEDRFFLFDNKGAHIGSTVGPMRKKIVYEIVDGKYLRTSQNYSMTGANGETAIRYGKVDGFRVAVRIAETTGIRGQLLSNLTFVFKGHKITATRRQPPALKRKGAEKQRG